MENSVTRILYFQNFQHLSNRMVKRNKAKWSGEAARLYPRKQKTGWRTLRFYFHQEEVNQREHDLVRWLTDPITVPREKRLPTRGPRENGKIKREKRRKSKKVKRSEGWKASSEGEGTRDKTCIHFHRDKY